MVLKSNDVSRLNDHLSAEVRACRSKLGMTLRQMDEALALPGGTIARIERGDKRLDCVTLLRLATFMGRSVDDFFATAPPVSVSQAPALSAVAVADISAIVEAYRAVRSLSARKEILSLIRSVADSPKYQKKKPARGLTL